MHSLSTKILLLISQLPLRVLYRISDALYYFQKYIIKYRASVITKNLSIVLPEKSQKEIDKIKFKFYRNLCDFPIESIKALNITQKELDKRLIFENLEILHEIKAQNRNVILLCGHIFNWEWLIGLTNYLPTKNTYAVYYPSHNKAINDLTIKTRQKFGTEVITMSETARKIMKIPNDGNSTFLMVSDQRPHLSKINYSLDFFNHHTPVFQGYDKLARKKNMAVVYINIYKKSRGKYCYNFEEIKPENNTFQPNEVVHKFYDLLEKNIKADPANWLLSHNRWKYKKGQEF